ncbi:hypothetical protein GCM10027578_19200 [Spirosoma luteolum]
MKRTTTTALLAVGLLGSGLALGQAPDMNQAAVDTLTKDVATAVFATINQPKAQEIYSQLLGCGDGCDARQIIRTVGSWDQVGQRIEELAILKNTKRFASLPPGEANAAIRQQLAQFYQKNKAYESYRKALTPATQAQILAKLDALLPPGAPAADTADEVAQQAADPAVEEGATMGAGVGDGASGGDAISSTAIRMGQLERKANEEKEKQMWMLLAGLAAGLVIGAGAFYLLKYRSLATELNNEQQRALRLENDLELAQRAKSAPAPARNQPTNPVRQAMTEQAPRPTAPVEPPAPVPAAPRSGELRVGEGIAPVPEPVVPPAPVQQQSQQRVPEPARNLVFYCPPPDPNGQFDTSQKTEVLSPESAYRFSVDSSQPEQASFRFEAEPGRLARLLTYRNYMIEPACESENPYTASHTRVTMRKDGLAVQENGTWRVKTKALIRYE